MAGDGDDTPVSSPATDVPDATVTSGSSAPADTTAPIPDAAQPLTAEPDVGIDVRARPFDRAVVRPDGAAADVYFYGGVQECYVLDRVEVDQTQPERIRLTLYEGIRPGAQACIEIAVSYVTTVSLAIPVAAASPVIDATDGQVKS